jgi:2-methylisocitrate lyase-like PEP mutase family enzyme
MPTKLEKFSALHKSDQPLVLYNIWHVGGAKTVTAACASAIATGSWVVADAFGYDVGQKLAEKVCILLMSK